MRYSVMRRFNHVSSQAFLARRNMEKTKMKIHLKLGSIFIFTACFLIMGCCAQEKSSSPAADEKPALAAPAPASTPAAVPPAGNIFQPSAVDPALVRQSMQARSEYEAINRRIIERTTKLYEENAEIKDLQGKMRELQKKIDELMANDKELAQLKKKYQSIAPEMPAMPRKPVAPSQNTMKK